MGDQDSSRLTRTRISSRRIQSGRRRRSLIRKSLASLRRVRRLLLKPSLRMPRNLSRLSSSRRSRLVSHKPRRRPSSPNCLLNTRKILSKSLLPFLKMKLRVRRSRKRAKRLRTLRHLLRMLRRSRPRKPVLSIKLELRSKPSSNHQSQLSQIPFPTQCQSQILLHSRLTSLRSRRKRKRRRLKSRPERLPSRPSHQTQLSPLLRPLRRSTRNSRRLNSPPRRPLRKLLLLELKLLLLPRPREPPPLRVMTSSGLPTCHQKYLTHSSKLKLTRLDTSLLRLNLERTPIPIHLTLIPMMNEN